MKQKILVVTPYYIPFVKGGGPIQSIKNLVEQLSDQYSFYIVTSDRDYGDFCNSKEIVPEKWHKVGKAEVYYISLKELNIRFIANIISEREYHKIYLNSFFSWSFSIKWILIIRLKNFFKKNNIVIAPRGEFSQGAFHLKWFKKYLFSKIVKVFNIYKGVVWQATAETEEKDIKNIMGTSEKIIIAPNLFDIDISKNRGIGIKKIRNSLRIVFISRIHPKKNLKFVLKLLKRIEGNIIFDIYGPIEDIKYWRQCQDIIKTLPNNIKTNYNGIIKHENVNQILGQYHIFLFPTLGENFGHVIAEALFAGLPVIISDQTPWKKLSEKNIGFDIPLNEEANFLKSINYYLTMDNDEYAQCSLKARSFINIFFGGKENVEKNYKLFKSDVIK